MSKHSGCIVCGKEITTADYWHEPVMCNHCRRQEAIKKEIDSFEPSPSSIPMTTNKMSYYKCPKCKGEFVKPYAGYVGFCRECFSQRNYSDKELPATSATKSPLSFEEWFNKTRPSDYVSVKSDSREFVKETVRIGWEAREPEIAELIAMNMQAREELLEAKNADKLAEVVKENLINRLERCKDDIKDLTIQLATERAARVAAEKACAEMRESLLSFCDELKAQMKDEKMSETIQDTFLWVVLESERLLSALACLNQKENDK